MTQLSKSGFIAKYNDPVSGEFPNNTSQAITSENLRNQAQDIADSLMFLGGLGTAVSMNTVIDSLRILAGNTSPIEVVPAPGAGLINIPIMFYVFMDFGSAAYATNTTFRFEMNTIPVSGTNTSTLTAAQNRYTSMIPIAVDTNADLTNQPILLEVQTGNPTTGDGSISVTVVYAVANSTASV